MKKYLTGVVAASLAMIFAPAPVARADIYQWEYINPANPAQGKQPSVTLAPDGAGVNAIPNADLSNRNLTMAYLIGANLSGTTARFGNLYNADLSQANLTNADFSGTFDEYNGFPTYLTGANLTGVNARGANFQVTLMNGANLSQANFTNASFNYSDLTGANFTNAEVRGAYFSRITADQLYSTASYQAHDLSGVQLEQNLGLNLAGQNLTNTLIPVTGANLTGAVIRGAFLQQITADQLYSTASYQAHDLIGVYLSGNQSGWNFAGQNLTNAVLAGNSTGADLTGADVRGAFLSPITAAQLYSTASYQARDLSGIRLFNNFMMGWNFAGQNLSNAALVANLDNANLSQANLTSAWIRDATLTDANLSQANLTKANFSGATGPFYDESGNYVGEVISPGANLTGANLSRADARAANFNFTTLSGASTANLIQSTGHIAGLNLGAGETLVAYAGVPIPVHVSGAFSIAPSATIDLTDNDLIVRATPETKDALHATVQAKIIAAQNGLDANFITNWDGPGVTSTSARTANVSTGFDLVGLGVIRNSDLDITTGLPGSSYTSFSGQPVSPDDVLVKYTYLGDANLDGLVSFDDYVGMDNAFFGLIPNLGWATGDINFDGEINFDDYTVVDQAFFFQGAPLSAGASVAAVPEPATALLIAIALLCAHRC